MILNNCTLIPCVVISENRRLTSFYNTECNKLLIGFTSVSRYLTYSFSERKEKRSCVLPNFPKNPNTITLLSLSILVICFFLLFLAYSQHIIHCHGYFLTDYVMEVTKRTFNCAGSSLERLHEWILTRKVDLIREPPTLIKRIKR